ncbi:alpha-amylase family protein [Halapricum hydrolyticum]|uniref:Alpha-amylase family protein n=1 Tax=Halapricum hydrolyticum TaxID=2979991 RepID=A0AAE3IBD1_9EURY|nr:alpha-amylase family protein [Halapricum hydrolyticum]MCU4716976.1 alpha-amylase family protein [Halapricum hydrolyticum]MCU4725419.1 alpha-amylase family protein [Halapricum hydrolyticum]
MIDQPEWFRDAVLYELDVKRFYDADGDGWGDFEGLRQRLDYLDRLGVDAIWLLPFYPSPMRDNGYDVADHYDVDDRLGTLEDFRAVVEEAHDRDIRVLIDMIFNHTSDQHEWFQRAREDPDSKYREFYCWTDDPESAYSTVNIFPEHEDGVWSYDEVADAHYFHQFYHYQPDLDIANPQLQSEVEDILEFWLEQGVDGFRVDAVAPMTFRKGEDGHELDDPHAFFRRLNQTVREKKADAVLLAEADDQPELLGDYFGDSDEFDLQLNFVGNAHLVYALGIEDTWPLERLFDILPYDVFENGQWANFLRNFDELNLLKLPDDAFWHAKELFNPDDEDAWIFERGHARRTAGIFENNPDRIAMAHSLMFSLPGSPVILAGDEIGMGEDLSLEERDPVRTPMQWSDDRNAGFSTADADDLILPVIDEGEFSYREINVADQLGEPYSLYNRVAALAHTRSLCSELWKGEFGQVPVEADDVWVFRAEYEDTVLITAHNLSGEYREVTIDPGLPWGATADLLGPGHYDFEEDGPMTFYLDGYDYIWVRGDSEGERVPLGQP